MSTLPGLSKNLELLVHLGQRCCWVPKHRGVACLSALPPCLPSNMPAPCSGVGELNTRGPFTSQTTEPHPQPLHHILTEAPAFWVLWSMTSLGICTCCSQIPPLPCLQLSLPLSAPFICPSVSRSLCHFLPLSECKLNPSSAAAACPPALIHPLHTPLQTTQKASPLQCLGWAPPFFQLPFLSIELVFPSGGPPLHPLGVGLLSLPEWVLRLIFLFAS